MRIGAGISLGVLLAFFVASCQADLEVGIDLRDNGAGRVSFAAGVNGATIAKYPSLFDRVNVSDIEQGGWTINGNTAPARLSASKGFTQEAQIQALMDEISPGAVKINRAERSRTSGRNRIIVQGEIYPGVFRQNLNLGSVVDAADIPGEAASVTVRLMLGSDEDFSERSWSIPLTSDETLSFSHTHTLDGDDNRLWRWVSLAAFSLLGLFILLNVVGWLHQRRRV